MTPETIIAVCSIIIAGAALCVTIIEARAARKHNRLSVRPHLEFTRILPVNPAGLKILISNTGLGPAFLRSLSVTMDGSEWDVSTSDGWLQLVKSMGFSQGTVTPVTIQDMQSIAAGDTVTLLDVELRSPSAPEFRAAACRLSMRIDYFSAYDEHSSSNLGPFTDDIQSGALLDPAGIPQPHPRR